MNIGRLYLYAGTTLRAGLICIGWEPYASPPPSKVYKDPETHEDYRPARYLHLFVKRDYWQVGPIWEYGGFYWSFGFGPLFLYCWG